MHRTITTCLSIVLISLTLIMSYVQPNATTASIYVATLLVAAAIYLFQFGSLHEFSIQALSASAKFIRDKTKEVERDATSVRELKRQIEMAAQEISSLREQLRSVEEVAGAAREAAERANAFGF